MRSARLIAVVVLALASATAWGARRFPQQIELAVRGGDKVVRSFPAVSGLTGWVLSRGGHYEIFYTTPDGKTLIDGELIDAQGKDLSEEYDRRYIPHPGRRKLFAQLGHTPFVAEGRRRAPVSVLYALFDPNCPYCHLAWKALQPYEKAGLQVRWVPVAYIKPSSVGKAAAILEAKDPLAAFRKNELGYDMRTHDGGIAPFAKPSAAARHQLLADNRIMQKLGASGTPALVWKDRRGKVQLKVGMPPLSDLPAITRLPEQAETDPALARFR